MKPTRVICRIPGKPGVVYESSARADLDDLVAALATVGGEGGHCMCLGTIAFELEGVGGVTLHHGETLRWVGDFGNVELADRDRMMAWLSARGMQFVREEYDAAHTRAVVANGEAERWQAAMPASLRPFFADMRSSGVSQDPAWTAAIESELPNPGVRARVLLALYGRAGGPWFSAYSSWEDVPCELLLTLPLATIEAAVVDDATMRGMLRLFGGWSFRKRRKKVSPAMRARLTAAALLVPDADRGSFMRALQ